MHSGETQPSQEQLRYFPPVKILTSCVGCHNGPGLLSLGTSGFSVMMDFSLSRGTIGEAALTSELPATPGWKESRYEYALLKGFLEASSP